MKEKIFFAGIAIVLLIQFFGIVSAQETDGDILFLGLELEKLLLFVNGLLATFLFVVSFIAYKRDQRKRLFYVSLAFLLFAVKSFLVSSELFFSETDWIDPLAVILEFAVMLSFFYGALKK